MKSGIFACVVDDWFSFYFRLNSFVSWIDSDGVRDIYELIYHFANMYS